MNRLAVSSRLRNDMYDPFVVALFIVGLSVSLANKICTDDQCYLWCIQQATRRVIA
ncbi:hypothetical protein [Heliothis virescens ascovirus 3g]|uniref:Uncharacterized protein n=1 Tax=Heliothis virescens ascovirus 3g TaxID=1246651 RepID=K4NVU7_9VIRU|nr:hypothetical protein F8204_gp174 [Heliothis virescens ascovirus 3g]AFV50426.1 hypothetical protein [Heliothis virescens ascovirus 3g]